MNRSRVIVAFLLSPFAAALYLLALSLAFDEIGRTDIVGMLIVVGFFAFIGYVAELTLGIPLLLLFRHFRLLSLPWFLFGGFVIGIAVFGFFGRPSYEFKWGLVYCVAPAIISTNVFWFLGGASDNKALQLTAG